MKNFVKSTKTKTVRVKQYSNGYKYLEIQRKFIPKPDIIYLKIFPDDHPLSAEEQIFYVKITEGIFGYNEQVRNEKLKVLAVDYNVKYLLPYLCIFIRDTIHLNIAYPDLTLLIYSIRMTKSLLSNPHLNLSEQLHIILPAILSCGLATKISRYYYDNHWTLRDFSAYMVATICQTFSNPSNNLINRVIYLYLRPLKSYNCPLTTIYGAVKGIASFGEETVKIFLFPYINNISKRIFLIFERRQYNFHSEQKIKQQIIEAKHVRDAVLCTLAPILYKYKNITDGGITYMQLFGYLGKFLYTEVKNLEKMDIYRRKEV
nr:unnamed protein product [Callosobruchus chinensis]